jgi:hypothetical protein
MAFDVRGLVVYCEQAHTQWHTDPAGSRMTDYMVSCLAASDRFIYFSFVRSAGGGNVFNKDVRRGWKSWAAQTERGFFYD